MTNRYCGGWLETVLVGAHNAGWCMRPYCTTCGCLQFRWAYWTAAARQAGIDTRVESAPHPRDLLAGFSSTEREVVVRTLVAGLRQLPPKWSNSEAFRTIIIDLDPPLIRHGVPMTLDSELSATPAGEELARIRAHAEWLSAERERMLVHESPQAVEERKRVKREKRAIAHAGRQSESRRRNTDRVELLASLARLSAAERLARFATDAQLALDCVPADLVPSQESELVGLEKSMAVALLTRIGRREGPWGRLRRLTQHLLGDEPE